MSIIESIDLSGGTRRFKRFGGKGDGSAKSTGKGTPAGGAPAPRGILDPDLLKAALPESIRKLNPRYLIKNPVMFVVEITAALVTLIAVANATGFQPVSGPSGLGFQIQIAIWLWFTVLFANFRSQWRKSRAGPGQTPSGPCGPRRSHADFFQMAQKRACRPPSSGSEIAWYAKRGI